MNSLKICFKVEKRFLNNKIFKPFSGDPFKWDSNLAHLLKKELEKKNFEVGTQDIIREKDSDIIIYNYYPRFVRKKNKINILIAHESIAVVRRLDNIKYLEQFDLVFTCNDKYVDNQKIFKINFSFDINSIDLNFKDKTYFLCNFSANKLSSHHNELYSERKIAINYFYSKLKKDFHLYGSGWDKSFKYPFPYNIFKDLNRYILTRAVSKIIRRSMSVAPIILKRLLYSDYECNNGYVDNKFDTLSKYKFSLCYENLYNENSYITEKIFDSLRMGVIPIYYGASNIADFIPRDIFINKNDFKTYEELYEHLLNLEDENYRVIIKKIKDFFISDQIKIFTDQYNVELISSRILTKTKVNQNEK
tara:strand:+ start:9133 stop:10218 length:1086 start_codon:yes stop_codon:yes gene_type:complete